MALVNRWYQILQLLVTHKEMTVTELQNKLAASPQTVRKSIETLNDELLGIAQIVQHKNEFQITIADFDQFDEVMAGKLRHDSDFNSSTKRISFLIKRLIEADAFILMDDLSAELGVSRGTVAKDIRSMKVLIEPFDVEVIGTPNRGMRIQGSEFDLRLLHIYYVQDYFEEHFLTADTRALIGRMTRESGIAKHHAPLLRKSVSIGMQRVLSGHLLPELPPDYTNYVRDNETVEEMLYQLELTYNVTLSQLERDFLSYPFNMNASEMRDRALIDDQALRRQFQRMMRKIHAVLVMEMDEEALFQEMKYHLMYMINRLVFRIEFHDLFYGEIERQYPFAYELAKVGLQELGDYLQRPVPSVEFSYLALYFELVLRRQPDELRQKEIAVVCSTGRGTALIIRRQLENVLGSEIKITHFSEEEYERQDLNQYFAVFTTIPLKNVDSCTPVIQLTNLFDDVLLRSEWKKAEQVRAASGQDLLFRFYSLDDQRSYQENIAQMIAALQTEALVDDEFQQRIFEREAKHTTIFEAGIAFPHTINKAATNILLAVGVFTEPLLTSDGEVEVVWLVAIPEVLTEKDENELLQLYDQLFAVAGDPQLRKELRQQKDVRSLTEWMKRKGIIS